MSPSKKIHLETPVIFESGQLVRTKDLEQAHYIFALPCPGRADPNYHTVIALSNILGGGMSSRLFQKAREDLGLCYMIYTSACCTTDSGMFAVYAGTGTEHIRTLSKLIVSQFIELIDTLSEKELSSTKTQLKSSAIMSQENSFDRCERLAAEMTSFGKVQTLKEAVAKVDNISLEQAKTVAQDLFLNTKHVMVTYAPKADVPSLDELTDKMVA